MVLRSGCAETCLFDRKPKFFGRRYASYPNGKIPKVVKFSNVSDVAAATKELSVLCPIMPLVVVIDGRVNSCVYEICRELKSKRNTSAFWLVSDEESNEHEQNLAEDFNLVKLGDIQYEKILKNLVADVVIVPKASTQQQRNRTINWHINTTYLFIENI